MQSDHQADDIEGWLLLPKLRIQNANAISSPLTWGFPAPSAFTGFTHALQRKMAAHCELQFTGVSIVCHSFEPQTHGLSGYGPGTFALTRNPVGKDGKTASIVEEGRTHLEVSLLIAVNGLFDIDEEELKPLLERAKRYCQSMRLAGGSILSMGHGAELIECSQSPDELATANLRIRRKLLPGFALVNRQDYMTERLQELRETNPEATALDVILDTGSLTVQYQQRQRPEQSEEPSEPPPEFEWQVQRKPGWMVPLPLGYQAISAEYPAGSVKNARDNSTPFQFVESIYGVGQWVSPHRVRDINQLFWYHSSDTSNGMYLCRNDYTPEVI